MQPSDTDTVREMYDDSADSYAAMMDTEIDLPIYSALLGRLLGRIKGLTGPVVDTSCGSGHMLALYGERFDDARSLIGVDLSLAMVEISRRRLGDRAEIRCGDMRSLDGLHAETAAAVISFFALHHLGPEDAQAALSEWFRILQRGGSLVAAIWEGSGAIDYGEERSMVALRYTAEEVSDWALSAGFSIERCVVEPVEDFPMDAIYLEAVKV